MKIFESFKGKNMKKLIALPMVAVLGLSLAACGGGNTADNGDAAGGDNAPAPELISVISREDGSGTRGAFIELLGIEVKGTDGSKKDMTTVEAIIVNKTDVMLTTVAEDLNAIGYVSLGSLNDTVKAVSIDGVAATAENVKNGSYAVSRPFFVATKGEGSELAQDFLSFVMSQEGQAVVAGSYITVDDSAAPYAGTMPEGKLTIGGSSSVTPVMEKLKEAYVAINPKANIEIQMSDSTSGMTAAIEGTVDIGMASRNLKDGELAELTATAIALDGIGIIVNPSNPIENLTSEQVNKIYIGEVENWSEVNG